jgi:hypothetical protein
MRRIASWSKSMAGRKSDRNALGCFCWRWKSLEIREIEPQTQ